MHSQTKKFVQKLVEDNLLRDTSVLCICAWKAEFDLFKELGFKNVVLTNVKTPEHSCTPSDADCVFFPYRFETQDAMNLTYDDESFDYVFVSDGLHHCSSPHRAILEMYRVARCSIFIFENFDSFFMRLAIRLGLTHEYENTNIFPRKGGGRNGSRIPNYVYRWTKREFEKTISSYYPVGKNKFRYFHGLDVPKRLSSSRLLVFAIKLAASFVPGCNNTLGLVATKPLTEGELHPWIREMVPDYKELLSK